MLTSTGFLAALSVDGLGPNRHREMSPDDRLALYRRVIGHLRIEGRPNPTFQQRCELATAIIEAQSITGLRDIVRAAPHIKALSEMLDEVLGQKAARAEGFIP